ncbi:uncharacterized protein N7484_004349 [Penicillium longicatenatum]|uniref:uncharacterized protein n=1 Tax=Penicillium longicatenatum TaxID=1561947 RepID=UPI002547A642|nr:uncharacterized protein N7484_004349 [Penicillium longicatenatum]KAJ5650626.1 hypothetical protein N7484_004349 [Penicillium longicatenatum]
MSITRIPTELVNEICGYLELSDWCTLRTTCNPLYTKSWDDFAKRYFESICISVKSDSLRRLEQLAADENLRTRIQELWIKPDLFKGRYQLSLEAFRRTGHAEACRTMGMGLEESYAQYQAISADHIHILDSETLTNTLTKCVARFENLRSFGLRSCSKASWHGPKNCPFTVGQDHVLVFSAIVKAVVATCRHLRTLHTCNGYHNSLTTGGLTVSQNTRKLLLPLIRGMESLHLCELAKNPDESPVSIMSDILVEAAPSLKALTYSQCCPNRNMNPSYLNGVSERLNFTQLTELRLCWIEITPYSFETLLSTAASTLKSLSLVSVNLNENNRPPLISDEEAITLGIRWLGMIKDPIKRAWGQIFTMLLDKTSLEHLSMETIGFRRYPITITDSLSDVSGKPSSMDNSVACYDSARARVSFREWISSLQVQPSRYLGHNLPGSKYSSQA